MSFTLTIGIAVLVIALILPLVARRLPAIRKVTQRGGDWIAAIAPRVFALTTFMAGVILLWSGATPARAGRMAWLNTFLPLPIVEFSAYFASIVGVGLIVLARGLQRRLDAAYHAAIWLLAAGIIFALASALDVEQAIDLSIMLLVLIRAKKYFYRKASIFDEKFTPGWIAAIAVVVVGTVTIAVAQYGAGRLGPDVFWDFGIGAEGPRAQRALVLASIVLVAFAATRLLHPARSIPASASRDQLTLATPIIAASPRASSQLAFLGDKSLMFNAQKNALIMYGVSGRSWVSLGDPIGPIKESVKLIQEFIETCDRAGGWPVFYRVPPELLHLYLDYDLAVVKLGEVARVSLPDFSLEGPQRRNLRRVWRKAVDEGCRFEVVDASAIDPMLPAIRPISDAWLAEKGVREKGFSLGRFDPSFIHRSALGLVKRGDEVVAFVTLWQSGGKAEVEVDLMRFNAAAPPGIMRYALIESMFWARNQGYAWFSLGAAPLSGIRVSAVTPVWNQLQVAVRQMGERYYNFEGLRNFKDWFYPEWEPTYLVSPGGSKRPIILANIASLISGSAGGVFRR